MKPQKLLLPANLPPASGVVRSEGKWRVRWRGLLYPMKWSTRASAVAFITRLCNAGEGQK